MTRENATWGAPRVASELRQRGHAVADSTLAKYLPGRGKPPSQTWRSLLNLHAGCLVSIDFGVVPTATLRDLYLFLVLWHERRQVVHVAIAKHPSAPRVSQKLREAFPFETAPRNLVRDRDSIYGDDARRTLEGMSVEEVVIAPRSPWQNPTSSGWPAR